MKLRTGDMVIVTIGKDSGRKGKISRVFPGVGKVLVPGINIFKRHTKSKSDKQPGGIIEIIKPLSVANVALLCPKCGKQTRVGYQFDKKMKNKKKKTRICKKCGALI